MSDCWEEGSERGSRTPVASILLPSCPSLKIYYSGWWDGRQWSLWGPASLLQVLKLDTYKKKKGLHFCECLNRALAWYFSGWMLGCLCIPAENKSLLTPDILPSQSTEFSKQQLCSCCSFFCPGSSLSSSDMHTSFSDVVFYQHSNGKILLLLNAIVFPVSKAIGIHSAIQLNECHI